MKPFNPSEFDPIDEHELSMQMRRIREKIVDEMEKGLHQSLKIFGNPDMAEAFAKMKKTQYDAFRMAGFNAVQAMSLLLGKSEEMK